MFRLIFKLVMIVVIAIAAYSLFFRQVKSREVAQFFSRVRAAFVQKSLAPLALSDSDLSSISGKLSASLDSIVTHPGKSSPVILGVQITNDSLSALVDIIRKLPPDQTNELKRFICDPATPSAQ